jgi:putative transposase
MDGPIDMAIDKALLDQLLAGREPQDLFAKGGLIDDLNKALSERMLAAELEDHHESEAEAGLGNRRNGSSKKTMLTGSSRLTLDIPRDRLGTFDPRLIAKYQRRLAGLIIKTSRCTHAAGRCARFEGIWRRFTALMSRRT